MLVDVCDKSGFPCYCRIFLIIVYVIKVIPCLVYSHFFLATFVTIHKSYWHVSITAQTRQCTMYIVVTMAINLLFNSRILKNGKGFLGCL